VTCAHTIALGAYVLGALDRDERAALEAHIAGCATCHAELDRLTPLPGLLSRVTVEEATAIDAAAPSERAEPPAGPIDGALAAVAGARRRSRRRRLAIATVMAMAVGVAGIAGLLVADGSEDDSAPAPLRLTASAWSPRSDVRAALALTERDGRARVTLRLAGVRPGQRCWLVARTSGGRSEVAARWRATYSGTATVPGVVTIPARRLSAFDVVTPSGRTLVHMPLRSR